MRSSPLPRMSRRGRVTIGVLVGVFILFTLLGWGVNAWTDWLWFDEVKYTDVFTTVLRTRLLLFLAVGLAMAVVIGATCGSLPAAPDAAAALRGAADAGALPDGSPRASTLDRDHRGIVGLFAGLSAQGAGRSGCCSATPSRSASRTRSSTSTWVLSLRVPFYRYLLGVGFTASCSVSARSRSTTSSAACAQGGGDG